ncbi:hypothetical protein [Streptomyces halobius]|uniref:Uncharacterized protein n=1 Tax=Streptomyces halobius TaxID=2879846 RepID=A0ABY4MCG5_9ACTN|nr:hypothetical protein [Streptomyces halobius]UQA94783.1 hypothetical protein K9S39_25600 [Streptomyces halobius]
MSNDQAPTAGDREIIKPMDKHMPIGAPLLPKKGTAKRGPADGSGSGAASTTDNPDPITEPKPAPIAESEPAPIMEPKPDLIAEPKPAPIAEPK